VKRRPCRVRPTPSGSSRRKFAQPAPIRETSRNASGESGATERDPQRTRCTRRPRLAPFVPSSNPHPRRREKKGTHPWRSKRARRPRPSP
jgi:hypothetical protein